MSTPSRIAALWVPDWPVLAAMTAEEVPAHRPAAVHDGRRVTAVSAPARAHGVRRGMRRRQAQECSPDLVLLDADAGRDVRLFEPVAVAAESVVAGIEVARPGLLLLPAQGASRFHGSEATLAELLVTGVAEQTGYESAVGVSDGAGAAVLAARTSRLVPQGAAAAFLAPMAVTELVHVPTHDLLAGQVPELVDLLVRLGLHTLGDLARLPGADVRARFGELGAWAHRVASGQDERPTAVRRLQPDVAVQQDLDPPVERIEATAFAARRLAEQLHAQLVDRGAGCGRLEISARTQDGQELVRTWRTDAVLGGLSVSRMTDRVRWQLEGWLTGSGTGGSGGGGGVGTPRPAPLVRLGLRAEEVVQAGAEQGRLWGMASGADLRAHRALHRVQGLIGAEAVLSPAVQGGRDARDQVHLVPWGEELPAPRPVARPWPGRLPAPAPATVLTPPAVVGLHGPEGDVVQVSARLELSTEPSLLRWSATHEAAVQGWAGPWPMVQRWWSRTPRRQVYLQVVTADGSAVLLALSEGVWTVEARYD
ncbi:DNA polymerase Y family protein [Actinotalea sp. K2]|uniref:DNA polymerase Y family protein n=1 Tax=Actinotalea sp. K2 TaxID=2939438 RepID=UPI0024B546CC|nr:DNA polymerase Y family protein [Actinotalea sp. K2]